jgi:hypothetical protein
MMPRSAPADNLPRPICKAGRHSFKTCLRLRPQEPVQRRGLGVAAPIAPKLSREGARISERVEPIAVPAKPRALRPVPINRCA